MLDAKHYSGTRCTRRAYPKNLIRDFFFFLIPERSALFDPRVAAAARSCSHVINTCG
jgi:hypothetical protein